MSRSDAEIGAGLAGVILEEQAELTLVEVSRICGVEVEWVVELVQEGVLEPAGGETPDWVFTGVQLRRVLAARRLQQDLGLNLPGVALALQLLDEIDSLRARL
jgi:chaperone modulatory protein CbpM